MEFQTLPPAPAPEPDKRVEEPHPEPAQEPERLPDYAGDWPAKGGLKVGDELAPQPWDLRAQGIEVGVVDDPDGRRSLNVYEGSDFRRLAPDAPDTVSPIVPVHGRPLLQVGEAGPAVRELAELLQVLGYRTTVSDGRNAFADAAVFDDSVQAAVERFRADYGVAEDPSQFAAADPGATRRVVGPWTWEGLLRAAERTSSEAEADRRQLRHPQAA